MRIFRITLFFLNAAVAVISIVVLNRSYSYMGWLAFAICASLAAASLVNALYVLRETLFDRASIKEHKPVPTATEQQQAIDN